MAKKITKQETLQVENVPVKLIAYSKTNPRKAFSYISISELAESMKAVGLIQPITVRETKHGMEVVAGERRLRAAEELEWETIPAFVKSVSDDEVLEIQILENLQREDVSPIDEANAFHTLLKKESLDWLTARIHKSKKYVNDRMKLTNLNPVAKQLLAKQRLPLSHAILISKLEPAEQIEILDKCFPFIDFEDDVLDADTDADDMICRLTYDDLKELIDDSFIYLNRAQFNTEDANLVPEAGACTSCPLRTINQNLLFDEITSDDKCTNKKCFDNKGKAHLQERLRMAQSLNKDAKAGSVNYHGEVKVGSTTYKQVSKEPAKGLVPVVITKTDRFKEEALGQVVYVDLSNTKPEKKPAQKPKEFNPEDHLDEAAEFNNSKLSLMAKLWEVGTSKQTDNELIKNLIVKRITCCPNNYIIVMAAIAKVIDIAPEDAYMEALRISDHLSFSECNDYCKNLVTKLADKYDSDVLIHIYNIAYNVDEIDDLDIEDEAMELKEYMNVIGYKN